MVMNNKYTLPPEIEAELAELPDPSAPCYLSQLQCVSIEVVVIARRLAPTRELRDEIDSILVEVSTPRILAAVRRHSGVYPHELEEAENEAMVLFWEALQDESFFEVKFNLAMKRLAQQAGRKIHGSKQRRFERSTMWIDPMDSEDSHGREVLTDIAVHVDTDSQLDTRQLVETGLATLPKEQARAIILHYLMGFTIYSQDSTVPTVASELGCGERKARRLIADGRKALERSIGQEEREDRDEQQSGPRCT